MTADPRKVVPVALVAVLAATTAWWAVRRGDARPAPLEASGTVEATEADLGFQIPGRIEFVTPREGDDVAAGAELAALDRTELGALRDAAAAQLGMAEARLRELERGSRRQEVASAEAAVVAARQREDEASTDAERARRLHEGGAISRQALEARETAHATTRAARIQAEQALALTREGPRTETREAQRAQVEQARAQLDRTEATLAQAAIRAPFAGRITVRHREHGEVVSPGAPVLTLLDRGDRWVRIYVPEDRMGRVFIGQGAEIRSDTWPERRYAGTVVFLSSEAEFTPRNVQTPEERTRLVYAVKVRITGDPDFDLKPGIPADVRLIEEGSAQEGAEDEGGGR